ncbi:MAG: hypothetical protein J6X22_11085 [Muribaculaceae bacterium]|nr:hypothetical protein [Muribaculaceae bacterium]
MKFKTLFSVAIITALILGFSACKGKKGGEQSSKSGNDTIQVIDNKDEITFLQSFLDNYIKLSGKEAQDLARKYLTADFYSTYIENCNNQDNAIDVICEVLTSEKVEKIDRIEKGSEDPTSFIVQVIAKDAEGKEFTQQYDMTVVNEDGKFKLADSQIFD